MQKIMNPTDLEQIRQVITNFINSHEIIPFFHHLEQHPAFGPMFSSLDNESKTQVKELINTILREKIESLRTKGGLLFRRFFENQEEKFWKFRNLNEGKNLRQNKEFQTLGKEIENEMFKLEGILTQAMMKKAQGLGKTVEAFYSIVYLFFPAYGEVE